MWPEALKTKGFFKEEKLLLRIEVRYVLELEMQARWVMG